MLTRQLPEVPSVTVRPFTFAASIAARSSLPTNQKKTPNAGHVHQGQDHQGHNQNTAFEKQSAGKYTCPMHPEVQSDKPSDCPKCGMALELSRPAVQKQKVIYTCPMHPEIEQEGPGQCPICGMGLEPKTVQTGCGGRRFGTP
jgi:P-type Cu+ transporter